MLDVFSHVGGFSLAALAAGAVSATAIDGSAAALDLARRGATISGVADRFETRKSDAFAALEAMAAEETRFGLVICDPPAFAPFRSALDAGLRAYERLARLATGLVEADGFLVLCSCSHAADLARFREACLRGIGRAGRSAQNPSHRRGRTGSPGASLAGRERLSQGAFLPAGAVRVLLDACVLFPSVMREMLLGTAATGAFVPLWSARILEEWARATRRLPAGNEAIARAGIAAMRSAWPGSEVVVSEETVQALSLPDPDDRHVLAAAVAGGAEVLMTLNRGDFPTRILGRHGLILREPDGFLVELHHEGVEVSAVASEVLRHAEAVSGRPSSLRALLKRAGMPRLGKALADPWDGGGAQPN